MLKFPKKTDKTWLKLIELERLKDHFIDKKEMNKHFFLHLGYSSNQQRLRKMPREKKLELFVIWWDKSRFFGTKKQKNETKTMKMNNKLISSCDSNGFYLHFEF